MPRRLRNRQEWKFFGVVARADRPLATAWWIILVLRGALPGVFAIAMGVLIGAVQRGHSLALPLTLAGAVFVLLQILAPLHQAVSANLGSRVAAWLLLLRRRARLSGGVVPAGVVHPRGAHSAL